MPVNRHFSFTRVECIQVDFVILNFPSIHLLFSDVRVMFIIVKISLSYWYFYTRCNVMQTLI